MVAITALVIVYVGREQALTLAFGAVKYKLIDFSNLTLGPKSNQFLVCRNDLCKVKPHQVSPTYDFPVEALGIDDFKTDQNRKWSHLYVVNAV